MLFSLTKTLKSVVLNVVELILPKTILKLLELKLTRTNIY